MRSNFITATGREVSVNVKKDKIGSGNRGAKSADLKKFAPVFEIVVDEERNLGLCNMPFVSVTPSQLLEFLKRVGASYDDPESAREAIKRSDFTPSELDALRESVAPFEGIPVAGRSDECTSAGVGLWHTSFTVANPKDVSELALIVKKILLSDFSRDVLAFKKRVDLPLAKNPGFFVMPVAGLNMDALSPILITPFHLNLIINFVGFDNLVNIGLGIGGANNKFANTTLSSSMSQKSFSDVPILQYPKDAKAIFQGRLVSLEEEPVKDNLSYLDFVTRGGKILDTILGSLRSSLVILKMKIEVPLYLELGLVLPRFAVLQCSEVKLNNPTRPEVPEEQKVLVIKPIIRSPFFSDPIFGAHVSGRGTVESSGVFYVESKLDLEALKEVNINSSGYVLIFKGSFTNLASHFTFADYSNAAAIICVWDPQFNAATHFNGALRESGIILLASEDIIAIQLNNSDLCIYNTCILLRRMQEQFTVLLRSELLSWFSIISSF